MKIVLCEPSPTCTDVPRSASDDPVANVTAAAHVPPTWQSKTTPFEPRIVIAELGVCVDPSSPLMAFA